MLIGSIQGLIFPLALVKPIFELVENFLNRKLMTISKRLKGAERLFKSFEKKCPARFLVLDMFSFTRIFLDVGSDQVKVLTEIFGQVSFGRMLHCPCSTSYSSRVLNTKNAARSGHKVHTTKAINFHGLANFSFFVHGTFDNGSTARSIKFSCLVTQQDTD